MKLLRELRESPLCEETAKGWPDALVEVQEAVVVVVSPWC
jgi:hypothetical protein